MTTPGRGPIVWMARNGVAANLLMLLILAAGAFGVVNAKQEVFPNFSLDAVQVTVPYPGSSPAEVEQGVLLAVEEAVRGLDGMKSITSSASEGQGSVVGELLIGADQDRVLADVKSAVGRIRSFPEEAEAPAITIVKKRQKVVELVIAGDVPLGTLHALAEQARSELLLSPHITLARIADVPAREIAIHVPRERLEEHSLSLEQIASRVRAMALELPAGGVDTAGGEVLLRVSGRRYTAADFAATVVRATPGGGRLLLGDIASITDAYEETDRRLFFNGALAVRLKVYRVSGETPQRVADAVQAYLPTLREDLPANIQLALWDDDSVKLRSRIDLLVRNAALGLVLVLIVLALFLDLRLAIWVSMGIPISFLGAFIVMPVLGLTVNMFSLFALIVVLGMVVDDAIIIGEAGFHRGAGGQSRMDAAIAGASEMAVPVTFAILTTMAAFAPLLFIPGLFGKLFRIIPLMVMACLTFSLIESFFILPAHLGHVSGVEKLLKLIADAWRSLGLNPALLLAPLHAAQRVAGRGLQFVLRRAYQPLVDLAVGWRYTALALALALLMLTAGVVASGMVPFSFFPSLEGDIVTVEVRFPYGSPVARVETAGKALESAARRAAEPFGGDAALRDTFLVVGESSSAPGLGGDEGGHIVGLEVDLGPSDQRSFSAEEYERRWRQEAPPLLGARAVLFSSGAGPGAGAAVALRLAHRSDAVLSAATAELETTLRGYASLTNIENDYASGKPQVEFSLDEPVARSLGLTSQQVATQIRGAFHGIEALREQRGRDEVKVVVRLPEEQRMSEHDVEALQIRTPAGGYTPLGHVVTVTRTQAPTTIVREEGIRVVTVSGTLAPGVRSPRAVLEELEDVVIPGLVAKHEGLTLAVAGEQEEQSAVFSSLGRNFAMALCVMFALLAVPLRSYVQPLIIMSAVPFGFIGAVAGHLVMGFALSLVSVLGIIALAGVVVNDSLVLVNTANSARAGGAGPKEAIVQAGVRRFRPILLTSLTTFFGLLPMILEPSVQARFLIPMAISLGFGVLFSSFLILLLVPALYMIVEDGRRLVGGEARSTP